MWADTGATYSNAQGEEIPYHPVTMSGGSEGEQILLLLSSFQLYLPVNVWGCATGTASGGMQETEATVSKHGFHPLCMVFEASKIPTAFVLVATSVIANMMHKGMREVVGHCLYWRLTTKIWVLVN